MSNQVDSGYSRLEDQISWYDKKCISSQRWFKGLKYAEITCAALVPLLAAYYPWITGLLGAGILIFEAVQYINQFQHNWITYRSTCEYLKHEKYLYLAKSGPYDKLSDEDAKHELAVRVETLISTEHAKWIIERGKVKEGERK